MAAKIKFALFTIILFFVTQNIVLAQGEVRWMRIGKLRHHFSEQGVEFEDGRSDRVYVTPSDGMVWPSDYGEIQQTLCAKAFWIGAKNVRSEAENKTYTVRVVGRGPRGHTGWQFEIFPRSIKMYAKYPHPEVTVGGVIASELDFYDVVDSVDSNLNCDRKIVIKFDTIIGVSVTKTIRAYSHPDHDDYFIIEWILTNTGIQNKEGTVISNQTLKDLYVLSHYRFAFAGEGCSGYEQGWANWGSTWGVNTMNHVVQAGEPYANELGVRKAFYSWYMPHSERGEWDFGCPNETADPDDNNVDEHMSAAKYAGVKSLYADESSDNAEQPSTTNFVESDEPITQGVSAFNQAGMTSRYEYMSSGHPLRTQWQDFQDQGLTFGDLYGGAGGGGYAQSFAYGPYTVEHGQSIRIVLAEAINGLSRAKNREVTENWLRARKGETVSLNLPGGGTTSNEDDYLRLWVETCRDSLIQTLLRAKETFQNNYVVSQNPRPPMTFSVQGGGDRILLTWSDEAESHPGFSGYEVWRSTGAIDAPAAVYQKIWESNEAVNSFADTSAARGISYFYYILSKANVDGRIIKSSKFFTMTSAPAHLLRPAGENLSQIRVVPNPYYINKRFEQFQLAGAGEIDANKIMFYDIPAYCKIKVFTERGDLVWQADHTDTSGDEPWNSTTMSGQYLTSGVYVVYFEATQDYVHPNTGKLAYRKGDHTYRKFIVIR